MKSTLTFLSLFSAFAFFSCEALEEATESEFDAKITKTINIDVTVNDPIVDETILVNMKEDEDVEKYFDKLKSVDVQSITLQITGLNTTGDNEMTDGSLSYSAITNGSEIPFYNFQSVDLNALSNAAPLQVEVPVTHQDQIEALLQSPGYLTFYLKGTVEQIPSSFTVVLTFNTKVKAGL